VCFQREEWYLLSNMYLLPLLFLCMLQGIMLLLHPYFHPSRPPLMDRLFLISFLLTILDKSVVPRRRGKNILGYTGKKLLL